MGVFNTSGKCFDVEVWKQILQKKLKIWGANQMKTNISQAKTRECAQDYVIFHGIKSTRKVDMIKTIL